MTEDGDSDSTETVCPECGSEDFIEDTERAEMVCDDCGFVIEQNNVDSGSEWRESDSDKGLTTNINWDDKDAYGQSLDSNKHEHWQNKREEKERKRKVEYGFSGEYEEISMLMRVEVELDALRYPSLGIETKRYPGSSFVSIEWDEPEATSLEVVLEEIIDNVYIQDVEGGDTEVMPRPIAESTTEAIRAEIGDRDGEGSDCATMLCGVIVSWDVADGYPSQKDDVDMGDIHSVYGGAVRDVDSSIESLGCYREIGVKEMVPSALAYAVEQSNDIDYYDLHSPM